MIYANPAPSEFSSGQYYEGAAAAYYLSPAKLESDYAPVRFEREMGLFRKYCRRGAVLDVGCSSGGFLWELVRRFPGCYEVVGTDVSGPALDYAESRGVPVARGNFLEHDFNGRRFDGITLWAVLEHVAAPAAFLRKASTLLQPEGICLILVPNMDSLAARLLGERYRYILPQHLNYFTAKTLSQMVQSNFSIVDLRSTHFNPLVLWQDWRNYRGADSELERARLLARTTAYKQNRWLKPVKGLYQITERFLGIFKLADNLTIVIKKRNS